MVRLSRSWRCGWYMYTMPTYGEGRKARVLQQRERRRLSRSWRCDMCTPCWLLERDGRLGYVNRGKDGTASFEMKTNFRVSISKINLVLKVPLYTWWDSQDLEDVGDMYTPCRLMERDGRLGYFNRGKDGKTLKILKMWVIRVHHATLWRETDACGTSTEVKMVRKLWGEDELHGKHLDIKSGSKGPTLHMMRLSRSWRCGWYVYIMPTYGERWTAGVCQQR